MVISGKRRLKYIWPEAGNKQEKFIFTSRKTTRPPYIIMNPILRPLLLFAVLFSLSISLLAQGNFWEMSNLSGLNVDQLSDQQVSSFYQYALQSKMSESDLLRMASQKGITQLQFMKLKDRMKRISMTEKPTVSAMTEGRTEATERGQELLYTIPMQEEAIDSSIFGSELFSRSSTVFEPNLRIATPASYIIGPDDELIINVYGLSEQKYQVTVNEEGEIYIPNLGPLHVSGMTIEEATVFIRSKLSAGIYSSLKTGRTRMTLSLGKIRSIRVSVIGQAKKTGSYTVSSLTTLYNLLYLCGGPSALGSYRNIEVIRGNHLFKTADLYGFLTKGIQSDNILLQEGDVIRIPFCENRILINGNVKRPGKFEVAEGETMSRVLEYCGGFDSYAYKKGVTLFRLEDNGKSTIDLTEKDFSTFGIRNGDEITVSPVREIFNNRVAVFGSVHRPGYYELSRELTLKSLIEKSGGLMPDAHLGSASVFRYAENRIPSIIAVNIDSVIRDLSTVVLQKNDSIFINSLFDFRDSLFVNVDGYVNRATQVGWRENLSLYDVIMEAGGIRIPGDSNRIEISRKTGDSDVAKGNHTETRTIFCSLHDNVQLQPYDYILVRNIPNYVNQRAIAIIGEVRYPGKYILEKSSERLSDVFKRCGGFKASADSVSITIRRKVTSSLKRTERERLFQRLLDINPDSIDANEKLKAEIFRSYELVSIRTVKANGSYESADNLILEDGDIITIEKNNNLVKISGEVYYPTIITYKKGKGAKYYIKQAGNYTGSANRKSVMIIYPDGRAKSVKRFLFFKNYPAITSRSEIFIPQKPERERNKMSYGELALIVTSMGILANLIIALFK